MSFGVLNGDNCIHPDSPGDYIKRVGYNEISLIILFTLYMLWWTCVRTEVAKEKQLSQKAIDRGCLGDALPIVAQNNHRIFKTLFIRIPDPKITVQIT